MKKLLLTLALICFLATPAMAQTVAHTKELTFAWEQRVKDLPHLGGWGLYMRGEAGGAHEIVIDIPYAGTDVGAGGEVQRSAELTVSGVPGSTVRKHFVADAYNKEGNRSAFSNEIFYDFEIPVADVTTPVTLRVIVTVQPQ